jgi:hypothetical protein
MELMVYLRVQFWNIGEYITVFGKKVYVVSAVGIEPTT